MAWIRCVTEMGMGVDVHGLDYTTAATRAVFDACIPGRGCIPKMDHCKSPNLRQRLWLTRARPLNSEFFHARAQCARIDAKNFCCTLFPVDHPACLLESTQDMISLDIL